MPESEKQNIKEDNCKGVASIKELFDTWNVDPIGRSLYSIYIPLYSSLIHDIELLDIIFFAKDYFYHYLSRCNKFYNFDFADFYKFLHEKMAAYITKNGNVKKKPLWENYIGALLNEIQYKLADINDSCIRGSSNPQCLHSNLVKIIFSICFPLLMTVVLIFYFLFNFSKIKDYAYNSYIMKKLLRKYIEDRKNFRNTDYITLDSAKKRINILYLFGENS